MITNTINIILENNLLLNDNKIINLEKNTFLKLKFIVELRKKV